MSLVSDYIGLISPKQFSKDSNVSNQTFDLNDTTFSDLLTKQMNNLSDNAGSTVSDSVYPLSVNIADIEKMNPVFNINPNEILGKAESVSTANSVETSGTENKDKSTSEVLTFFTSIFDSKPDFTTTESNGLFDFERKMAANFYGKYAKNVVTDLKEFISDATKIKS